MDEQNKQLSNERSALGEKLSAKQREGVKIRENIEIIEKDIHKMANTKYKVIHHVCIRINAHILTDASSDNIQTQAKFGFWQRHDLLSKTKHNNIEIGILS